MPNQNLLNINADKLFEQHTISEIIEIQKKLQVEIERKREELRTMVGERYRDLIEAADTIGDMKKTAEGIISHIDTMSIKCQQLQQKQLLGFKLDTNSSKSERISKNRVYHSIAIQIKILMDIPEQIWSAVEKEDYILGAQLFLFARHINTGLQLHSGVDDDLSSNKVMLWFPVISRQWSSINHFRETILSGCQNMLQSHSLSSEDASSCLSTLVLLEGIGSLELLNKLLGLRTQALQDILQSDSHNSVKTRVCTSLKHLVHTITLLHACFLDDCEDSSHSEGLIWKQLKSIVGRDAPPSITLVDLKDSLTTKFLPPLVLEFRPSTTEPVNPVSPGVMRENVTRWLEWVHNFVQQQVTSLLSLVSSVRGLHGIREEAGNVVTPVNWDTMCQRLMIPRGLNIWDAYFQPLLTRRAKTLVSQQWNIALVQLQSTLISAARENLQEKCSQPENDLRWLVWKEWSSDLPQVESNQNQQQKRGLLMKTKGYSPCVERLCAELDSQLLALLQDLEHYLQNTFTNKSTDGFELQEHLQSCSMESIQQLIQFIKKECMAEVDGKKVNDACVVMIARFLQALCDLCPNLQKCFSVSQNSSNIKTVVGSPPTSTPWQEACLLLRQESIVTWQQWQYRMSSRLQELVKAKLGDSNHLGTLLHSLPQWDVVTIEEEADEGRSIRSDIKVPSQPSFPLQSLLNSMAKQINAVAPHTLPRKIHQDLVESLVGSMLGHYEEVSNASNAIISQAQALQLLLDIKYLTMLLVPRDNKVLMGKSQMISDKFEDKIDPFDLDVFCPYIQSNIKRSVQRSQGLLGVLIVAWPEKLAVMSGLRAASINSLEDPSVLSVSINPPWFPLLPVTGPPGTRILSGIPPVQTDKPQRKKSSPKPKTDQTPGELMRSGAAAFFGAMSSDWFGSS